MNSPTTENRNDLLSTLENLIEISRDGQEGFGQAAEHANDASLKELFAEFSKERATIVGELRQLERDHGKQDPDSSGSVTGTLHRAWMNLRTAISSRNDLAILEEAERGEDAAVAAYREALKPATPPLPRSITEVLERHLSKIQKAHDTVRERRNAARVASNVK